ncbi:diacylglycerol kinase family protein [Patescibacteria group bacterium]
MSFINIKSFVKSVSYAWRGIRQAYKSEQNFRLDTFAAVIVVALMVFFRLTWGEVIVLTLMIILVMVLELVNTSVEKMTDLFKPRMHHYAEAVKDILAGAVLIASLGALFVGFLIFYPYILGQK